MFSLRTLFIVVAVSAFGIAALVNRTPIWTSIFVTLTLALILAAAVLAILRPAHRAFWVPVAMVGIVHLVVIYLVPFRPLSRYLFTTQLTVKTCDWVLKSERDALLYLYEAKILAAVVNENPFGIGAQQQPPFPQGTVDDAINLSPDWYYSAQTFWTLILAFGSGFASSYFLRPK